MAGGKYRSIQESHTDGSHTDNGGTCFYFADHDILDLGGVERPREPPRSKFVVTLSSLQSVPQICPIRCNN